MKLSELFHCPFKVMKFVNLNRVRLGPKFGPRRKNAQRSLRSLQATSMRTSFSIKLPSTRRESTKDSKLKKSHKSNMFYYLIDDCKFTFISITIIYFPYFYVISYYTLGVSLKT